MSPLQQSVIGGVLITLLIFSVLALMAIRETRRREEKINREKESVKSTDSEEKSEEKSYDPRSTKLSPLQTNQVIHELKVLVNILLQIRHKYGSEVLEVTGSDIADYGKSLEEKTLGTSIPKKINAETRFQWFWDPRTDTRGIRYLSEDVGENGETTSMSSIVIIQGDTVLGSRVVNSFEHSTEEGNDVPYGSFTKASSSRFIRELTHLIAND